MKYTIAQTIDLLNKEFTFNSELEPNDIWVFAKKYGFEEHSGVSRFCLYQKHWKEVIKLSRFAETGNDYNAIELAHYQKACEMGCDKILLPTRLEATLTSGLDVYVQTRYTRSYSDLSYSQVEALRISTRKIQRSDIFRGSERKLYDSPATYWYARAWQIYGKQFMKRFEQFTCECEVGDLHTGNIGFLDKRPIILDYAGYFG